jgi:hypothetical protein
MKVKFYYGKCAYDRAYRDNSKRVAVVAIQERKNGYYITISRRNTGTEITAAAITAIFTKWKNEIHLKPRPKGIYFEGADPANIFHRETSFSMVVPKARWKAGKCFSWNFCNNRNRGCTSQCRKR